MKRVSIVSSNTIAATGWIDYDGLPGTDNITQNAGRITVSTLPDSWTVRNAWKRGFDAWNRMNKRILGGSNDQGSIKPKYHDFKIRGIGSYAPSPTYAVPVDNGSNALVLGEWTYSELVSPDGTTGADSMLMHMLGTHVGAAGSRTSISLVESYANSRATVDVNEPNMAPVDSDDPIMNLFDDGTVVDEVVDNLLTHNEDMPYDNIDYPGEGSNMPQPLVVHQTTLGADGRSTVGGFNAICGLLEFEITSPLPGDVYSVLVELAPGNYRGIAADVI